MIRFFAVACVVVSILADDYSNGYPKGLPAAISTATSGKIVASARPDALGIGGINGFSGNDAGFDGFALNHGFGLNQYIHRAHNNPYVPYKLWRYPRGVHSAISTATGGQIATAAAAAAAAASGSGGFNRFGRIDARFDRFELNRGFGLNQNTHLPFNNPNFPYKPWAHPGGVSPYKPWAYPGGVSPYKPWAHPGGISPYKPWAHPGGVSSYKPWAYPGGVSPYKPWAYPGGVSPYKPWTYPGGVSPYNNPNLPLIFDEFAGIGLGGLGSSFRGRRLRKTY